MQPALYQRRQDSRDLLGPGEVVSVDDQASEEPRCAPFAFVCELLVHRVERRAQFVDVVVQFVDLIVDESAALAVLARGPVRLGQDERGCDCEQEPLRDRVGTILDSAATTSGNYTLRARG